MADPVRSADAVTPAFLSALLGQPVVSVKSVAIGTGQVGSTVRFTCRIEGADAPLTLIGKFASLDATSRAAGLAQGSYVRETGFYKLLAPGRALPVPNVFHVSFDAATHDFALLMEDLGGHRVGDQLTPLGVAEARASVDALARVHTAFWNDASLDTHAFLPGAAAAAPVPLDALYDALWPAFVDRYGARVTAQMHEIGNAFRGRVDAWAAPRGGARTLLHGDCRPDNLLFAIDGGVVIVDWQTIAVGSPATDLAYFLGTSLTPEDRRTHEAALFDRWFEALPDDADRDALWSITRRDALAGFLVGVAASMLVVRTERGDAMFLSMCARSAAMTDDHRSLTMF